MFRVAPTFNVKDLENLIRHNVFSMLLRKGKVTREFVRMMEGWRHSGFKVFCGERTYPYQKRSLERLAAYLIRACPKRVTGPTDQAYTLCDVVEKRLTGRVGFC